MSILVMLLSLEAGVDLDALARRYDFAWKVDSATGRHTIHSGELTLVVAPGMKTALVNGKPRQLKHAPVISAGLLKLPEELAGLVKKNANVPEGLLRPLPRRMPVAKKTTPKPNRKIPPCKIVIDPGHGGKYTGYVGRAGVMEKDINLEVSLKLAKLLESWGATVIMTREEDRHFSAELYEDLAHRVSVVNQENPDLFLSIHTNGVKNPSPRGFEIWVPKNARGSRDSESRRAARLLRAGLVDVWGPEDRGTKDQSNFYVLRNTRCPATLVEIEFVSNPFVERRLALSSVRTKIAEVIAESVRKWAVQR